LVRNRDEIALRGEQSGALMQSPGSTNPSGPSRLLYLDVLRAIAILLVLGAHLPVKPAEFTWGREFFLVWQRVGWVGVDLFFCLSGFLIGGLLFVEFQRRGHIDFVRFIVRRAFKIWPSYILFVIVATGIVVFTHRPLDLIWPNVLHVQNYFPSVYGHTWSLAVEEHFYLALPLLLAGLIAMRQGDQKRTFAPVPWLFVAISAACLLMRLEAASGIEEMDFYRNQAHTHIRFDSLFGGVFLAYLTTITPHSILWVYRWRHALPIVGCACFLPAFLFELGQTPFLYTAGYTLLTAGSMAIILWNWFAATHNQHPGSSSIGLSPVMRPLLKLLGAVGAYSYSIYLWHMPVATASAKYIWTRFLNPEHPASLILLAVAYVLLAVVVGMTLYRIVEKPALAVRDRMFPATVGNTNVINTAN
jgi:peptidoglycan/LPS O-acetylase OafA/YrhL